MPTGAVFMLIEEHPRVSRELQIVCGEFGAMKNLVPACEGTRAKRHAWARLQGEQTAQACANACSQHLEQKSLFQWSDRVLWLPFKR
jgi:hypothetical protein